jgi:hypothetical protein
MAVCSSIMLAILKNIIFNIAPQRADLNNVCALILVAKGPLHDVKTSTTAGYPAYV